MNYSTHITIVSWDTRNWRHRDKAVMWCKDFGLSQITRHVFVGELYTKERRQLELKFKNLFSGKTEKILFVGLCRSCFNESMFESVMEKIRHRRDFELVQIPNKA